MPADFRIDELIDFLAERLAKRVETRLNNPCSTIRPRLLPVGQAAYYLGRTEDSIRHLIASGTLPVVRTDNGSSWTVRILTTGFKTTSSSVRGSQDEGSAEGSFSGSAVPIERNC